MAASLTLESLYATFTMTFLLAMNTPTFSNAQRGQPLMRCVTEGLFPYPYDCSKFYQCARDNPSVFIMDCAPGTFFNPSTNQCDIRSRSNCGYTGNGRIQTTQPPPQTTIFSSWWPYIYNNNNRNSYTTTRNNNNNNNGGNNFNNNNNGNNAYGITLRGQQTNTQYSARSRASLCEAFQRQFNSYATQLLNVNPSLCNENCRNSFPYFTFTCV